MAMGGGGIRAWSPYMGASSKAQPATCGRGIWWPGWKALGRKLKALKKEYRKSYTYGRSCVNRGQ